MRSMHALIVSDIDGVIADCKHRLPLLKEKKYDEFYSLVGEDSLISTGYLLLDIFDCYPDTKIVFLTGRRESSRKDTMAWLRKNEIHRLGAFDAVFMRDDTDHRPSEELKPELFEEILKMYQARGFEFDSIYYIDDDPENVKGICDKFSQVQGVVFGLKRIQERR